MTKPTPNDAKRRARQRKYLQLMFAMNPMWQAPQVLALRRKSLGLKRAATPESSDSSSVELAQLRARATEQVKSLQQDFWTLPLGQLKRSLGAIRIEQLPELVPVVNRLKIAASCRGQFPLLAQAKAMDTELFHAFKVAVVLPPAEAGFKREKFLQSIRDRKRLKEVKRAVNLIRRDHPVLYELESDWFETMQGMKRPSAAKEVVREPAGSFELPEMGWGTWILIVFVLRMLIRLLFLSD